VPLSASAAYPIFRRHRCSDQPELRFYLLRLDFPLPVFRSRANLEERQFRICLVIGCRLPNAEEIEHSGSAICCWITRGWRPLDDHFERFVCGNRAVVARVNSTQEFPYSTIIWLHWQFVTWKAVNSFINSFLIMVYNMFVGLYLPGEVFVFPHFSDQKLAWSVIQWFTD